MSRFPFEKVSNLRKVIKNVLFIPPKIFLFNSLASFECCCCCCCCGGCGGDVAAAARLTIWWIIVTHRINLSNEAIQIQQWAPRFENRVGRGRGRGRDVISSQYQHWNSLYWIHHPNRGELRGLRESDCRQPGSDSRNRGEMKLIVAGNDECRKRIISRRNGTRTAPAAELLMTHNNLLFAALPRKKEKPNRGEGRRTDIRATIKKK